MDNNIQEQPQRTVKDFISKSISSMREVVTKFITSDKIAHFEPERAWEHLKETDSAIENLPKEQEVYNPEIAYKKLDGNISDMQMVEFIEKDRGYETQYTDNKTLKEYISYVPNELRTEGLLLMLHEKYDNTELANELSYALITNNLEINETNALKAINYFSNLRFMTEYDPIGADDPFGQVCGCDYYIHPNMKNPVEYFSSDLLTVQQWHNIAAEDTRLLEFIPKKITDNENFWKNYTDFIEKGDYLSHPDNEWMNGCFDEYEVFSKMPKSLMENTQISIDLFKRGVVGIDYVKEPNEELYLFMKPENYGKIPETLREKETFKVKAAEAIKYNCWQILDVPEKIITEEMVSAALSYDMELCKEIPTKFLTEDLLVDKIKDWKQQGFFQAKHNEHPRYIEIESNNHTKVLQYIPNEFKTEKVCQEALKANPQNAEFLPKNLRNKFEKTLADMLQVKEETNPINKDEVYADLQQLKAFLGKDKNYMDAIDILQDYDKKISQNPEPVYVSTTREMFSAILEKAGYDTAAEHLLFELETKNLNRLFGLNNQKTTDIRPEDIHVPGLDETEIRKHLVDIAQIEKASIQYKIRNQEELYNTHIQEHYFEVTGEGKPESIYQHEKEKLSKEINLTKEVLESEFKNRDEFILKEKMTISITQDLKNLNINIEEIKKNNIIEDLLNKGKTSSLIKAHISVGETKVEFSARLSVKADEQGNTNLLIHPKRELETELSNGFKGHKFTEEEKGNLRALGAAGKVISIKNEDGISEKYLIGTDSLTNEVIAVRQQDVRINDEFRGVILTEKKKEDLISGRPIFLDGIKSNNIECSGLVQYNLEKGRLELLQYGISISVIQNIKLQKDQQELLKEGKTVLISGLFDEKGIKYNAWVRLDTKSRKLMQSREMPEKQVDVKKEIAPASYNRVQVNQNSKGFKTEENKLSTQPLLSGTAQNTKEQEKNSSELISLNTKRFRQNK